MTPDDQCGICEITRKLCDDLTAKGIPRCCSDCTHELTTLEDEVSTLRAQVSAITDLAVALDREANQLDTNGVLGNAASHLWATASRIRRTLAANEVPS